MSRRHLSIISWHVEGKQERGENPRNISKRWLPSPTRLPLPSLTWVFPLTLQRWVTAPDLWRGLPVPHVWLCRPSVALPSLRITFEQKGVQDYLSPDQPPLVLSCSCCSFLFLFLLLLLCPQNFLQSMGRLPWETYSVDPRIHTVHTVSFNTFLRAVLGESRREVALLISLPSIPSKEETNWVQLISPWLSHGPSVTSL